MDPIRAKSTEETLVPMEKKKNSTQNELSSCERCVFYDYDEELEEFVCMACLDQDELSSLDGHSAACRYFRFYDEYKSVQKQN